MNTVKILVCACVIVLLLAASNEVSIIELRYMSGEGGTPIYGLYSYVPRNRVWFFEE